VGKTFRSRGIGQSTGGRLYTGWRCLCPPGLSTSRTGGTKDHCTDGESAQHAARIGCRTSQIRTSGCEKKDLSRISLSKGGVYFKMWLNRKPSYRSVRLGIREMPVKLGKGCMCTPPNSGGSPTPTPLKKLGLYRAEQSSGQTEGEFKRRYQSQVAVERAKTRRAHAADRTEKGENPCRGGPYRELRRIGLGKNRWV